MLYGAIIGFGATKPQPVDSRSSGFCIWPDHTWQKKTPTHYFQEKNIILIRASRYSKKTVTLLDEKVNPWKKFINKIRIKIDTSKIVHSVLCRPVAFVFSFMWCTALCTFMLSEKFNQIFFYAVSEENSLCLGYSIFSIEAPDQMLSYMYKYMCFERPLDKSIRFGFQSSPTDPGCLEGRLV